MNPDTRNLIAAICLSMSVLIGYQILFGEPTQQNVKKEQQLVDKNNEPSIELPKDNNTSLTEVTKKTRNIDRINIINDKLEGSISLLGARIDDLVLKKYRKTLDPESDQIRFLKKIDEREPFFIQFGWSSPNKNKVPNGNTVWKGSKSSLDPNNPVTLTWNNGEGLKFSQIISIDDNYMIKVIQKVKNETNNSVNLYPYGLIRRSGEPKTTDFFVLHEGPLGVFDGSLKEHSYSDLKETGQKGMSIKTEENGGWIGITDKYWICLLYTSPSPRDRVRSRMPSSA